MKRHRGSILILALWSLSFLAVLSLSVGYGARQKATLLNRLDTMNHLYAIAYSGVEKARGLFQIEDPTSGQDTLLDEWAYSEPDFKEVPVGDGHFTVGHTVYDPDQEVQVMWYGLIDEERKINVNTADAATLSRLFEFLGELDSDEAQKIGYAIMDWRDADSMFQHPRHGAEDDFYEGLKVPYQSKDALLESVDELLLVDGMNREIFDKIEPYVTVFGSGEVNINTASEEVLLALGLGEGLVTKIFSYRAGLDGEMLTADDRYFASVSSIISDLQTIAIISLPEEAAIDTLVSFEKLSTASNYYQVRSKGVLTKNGASLLIEAVIDRDGKVYFSRMSGVQWPPRV